MTGLTVIGSPRNRGFRVIWLLEELGLPYALRTDPPQSEAVRALNPLGKVPILIDGGAVITDSVAIMAYLADREGRFTFPAGTPERGRQDGLTQFLVDEMDALLWTAARHSFILPDEHRVPGIKDSLRWEFERSQVRFEALLGDGPFLMGGTMTVADFLAGHCGGWASRARFPVTSEVFRAYLDRLRSRPAYQRARSSAD